MTRGDSDPGIPDIPPLPATIEAPLHTTQGPSEASTYTMFCHLSDIQDLRKKWLDTIVFQPVEAAKMHTFL